MAFRPIGQSLHNRPDIRFSVKKRMEGVQQLPEPHAPHRNVRFPIEEQDAIAPDRQDVDAGVQPWEYGEMPLKFRIIECRMAHGRGILTHDAPPPAGQP